MNLNYCVLEEYTSNILTVFTKMLHNFIEFINRLCSKHKLLSSCLDTNNEVESDDSDTAPRANRFALLDA